MQTSTPPSRLSLRQLAECDQRVFPSYPQVGRYYPAAAIEDARKRLGRAIERGEGPGLVIGPPGTGKSLLLQVLAAQYHEQFDIVLLAVTRLCSRRALLQAILFELGLPYKMRDEGELRLSLLDHLLSADQCPTGLLLLVDEAHTLSVALLDELRVLTNLVRGDRPRVRLVLAGSSLLEEAFAHPVLESFSQRLSARCYLAPLGRHETTQYIRAQLAASNGAADEVFAPDACDAVFEATDGVPRLVNQLCDRALQFGAADDRSRIDRDLVQRAWSDLQQLPTPWEAPPETAAAAAESQVIEFGSLANNLSECHDVDPIEEPQADIEPTELDVDEETSQPQKVAAPPQPDVAVASGVVDPFAEEFEEEEVVLDNFAAWDDLFRRDAPRVENRRDPGFATLVETALNASPDCQSEESNVREELSILSEPAGLPRQDEAPEIVDAGEGSQASEEDAVWPPLRLAVVSDPAPLKPIPLLPPSSRAASVGTAAALDNIATVALSRSGSRNPTAEPPLLLVEEDGLPDRANPPVRREQYRHLFSRLRSG